VELLENLKADGFVRTIVGTQTATVDELLAEPDHMPSDIDELQVVIDRLTSTSSLQRVRDSLETAMQQGEGHCTAYIALPALNGKPHADVIQERVATTSTVEIDGRNFHRVRFDQQLTCEACNLSYPTPQPQLFNFNSPLGACVTCEGFGNLIDIDMDLIVPDPSKSLKDGAIAPWNTPAYAHELEELLELAPDFDLPVEVPYSDLSEEHRRLIREGVPSHNFGGLEGFFAWLERRKYKMHLRVFLSRWRSSRQCPDCKGTRYRPEVLAIRIGGKNLAELSSMKVADAVDFFDQLQLTQHEQTISRTILEQVVSRLRYLRSVGVGYLSIDRPLKTLSGGEMQRVALTSALGSSLVNMLYVLD